MHIPQTASIYLRMFASQCYQGDPVCLKVKELEREGKVYERLLIEQVDSKEVGCVSVDRDARKW